jgi:hypothetical protein
MEHQSHKYGMQKSVGDYLTLNICHRYSMQKSLCVLWFIVVFPEATGRKRTQSQCSLEIETERHIASVRT